MSDQTETTAGPSLRTAAPTRQVREGAFRVLTLAAALVILAVVALVLWELLTHSIPSIERFGVGFLTTAEWNANGTFGVLAFLTGTVLTSAMALVLAVPVSFGISILLTQYLPGRLRDPLVFVVELLAAIPSVVYGLWGLLVFAPLLQNTVDPVIAHSPLGLLPIFGPPPTVSTNLFVASVVLAVMITPIITSFSREALMQVPTDLRDGGLALGLTRWEVIRGVVLPYARAGVFSAVILGLGRALGETMAVTILVGNTTQVVFDFFKPGFTMSSLLANEFNQTSSTIHTSSLFEVGLVLFVLSFVVNSVAHYVVERLSHEGRGV